MNRVAYGDVESEVEEYETEGDEAGERVESAEQG